MNQTKYIIITPARNEEKYIEETIKSVVSQTILPQKWVIVSDGSTDRTDEIVKRYCAAYSFIQLMCSSGALERNFGSKVHAFNAGYYLIKDIAYDFIGNLDADISFGVDYFEKILYYFGQNNKLGIAGGIIQEFVNGSYITQKISLNSVAGAVQLFRRECYESIGGYFPLEYGGIDTAAEIMARSKGFHVHTFPELKVTHHRRVGFSDKSILAKRFMHWGRMHYSLGYHPVYYFILCCYKIFQKPYFFHGLLLMLGFIEAYVKGEKRALSADFVQYVRQEQVNKLLSIFKFKS